MGTAWRAQQEAATYSVRLIGFEPHKSQTDAALLCDWNRDLRVGAPTSCTRMQSHSHGPLAALRGGDVG